MVEEYDEEEIQVIEAKSAKRRADIEEKTRAKAFKIAEAERLAAEAKEAEAERIRLEQEAEAEKIRLEQETEAERIRLRKDAEFRIALMEFQNHTVFKTPEGTLFAISNQVLDTGYRVNEGVEIASNEERINFLKGIKEKIVSTLSEENRIKFAESLKAGNALTENMATLLGVPYLEEVL